LAPVRGAAARDVTVKDDAAEAPALAAALLLGRAAQVDALGPLPGLDAAEEQDGLDDDDDPLPADALVEEHLIVDDGNLWELWVSMYLRVALLKRRDLGLT